MNKVVSIRSAVLEGYVMMTKESGGIARAEIREGGFHVQQFMKWMVRTKVPREEALACRGLYEFV
eukprot:11228148-Lingulodinium_polyedra.AAC.1